MRMRCSGPSGPGALPSQEIEETLPESLSAKSLRAWIEFAEEPKSKATGGGAETEEEVEVDAVLEEFGGDVRAAIRALLHDLASLAGDFTTAVSRGYVRGVVPEGGGRPIGRRNPKRHDA